MGISHAMQAGVSGLRANAAATANVSTNIANANTDGYRRTFAQMVTTTAAGAGDNLPPRGVQAVRRSEVDLRGELRTTRNADDLAVRGEGFFVVSRSPNDPDLSNYALTRAGSFRPDAEGNLRNAAGFYLAGFPGSGNLSSGSVVNGSFASLSTVNVASDLMPGSVTTTMALAGNLPSQETGLATPGDPFVTSSTYYTALGGAENLTFSWQPSATPNAWTLTIADSAGTTGSVDVTFADSGPQAGMPTGYANHTGLTDAGGGVVEMTVAPGGTAQPLRIALGATGTDEGLTQFAGDYTLFDAQVDGNESGTLTRTEFAEDGTLYGVFDNGDRRALFEVPLAMVSNPNGMTRGDGNVFHVSRESGGFNLMVPGSGPTGTIAAGALESSNVELADELTSLIEIQHAYSSNAKIITTVDEMLDETMRIKR